MANFDSDILREFTDRVLATEEQVDAAPSEFQEDRKIIVDVLRTRKGKLFLETLRKYTVDRPNLQHNPLIDPPLVLSIEKFILVREGQNNLVRFLEFLLKLEQKEHQ